MSNKKLIIFIMLIVLFTSIHIPASAEEAGPAYSITGYFSNVTLYADGSAYFDEYITYKLLDTSAQTVKSLPMSNASGISGLEVYEQIQDINDPENKSLKQLEQADEIIENSADVYTYSLVNNDEDIYDITIPVKGNKKQERTFVYRYKLKDMVFLYKDTAAFFWQFVMPGNTIKIENVEIQVILPSGVPTEDLSGFVGGSSYVQKQIMEDGTFWIGSESIKQGESLETALLMPKTLYPDGRKIIDNYAKDAIVSDMSIWEDEALTTRKKDELKLYSSWGIAFLSALLSLGTGILLYLKVGRKKKQKNQEAVKGIPAAYYSPAELGVLFNNGRTGARDFLATILYLVQTRYLELHFDENQIGSLIQREDIQRDKLKPHEEYALDWLIKDLGDGSSVPLEKVEQLLTDYSKKYKHKVTTWESLVDQKAAKWKFSEKITKLKLISLGASVVGVLAAILSALVLKNQLAGAISIIFALGLAAYTVPLKKLSQFGLIHYTQWELFKDYMGAELDSKSTKLPLKTWEQYLVYSIPLGMAKEVLTGVTGAYKRNAFEDGNLTILYLMNHVWLSDKLDKVK